MSPAATDEHFFEETFGAAVQVEMTGRPLIFEGDFNGDGNKDAMAVVRFDSKTSFPKEVKVLKPWGESQLQAPPRPRALAIVHKKGTQTINQFILLGDAPDSWSREWHDMGLEILDRGKVQEALPSVIPKGDVIQMFTQAGIDTFLYWDGETYQIFEPDEEP